MTTPCDLFLYVVALFAGLLVGSFILFIPWLALVGYYVGREEAKIEDTGSHSAQSGGSFKKGD
jgi:hypothetical protein